MKNEMWESKLIDYIDGKGSKAEREEVERELSNSEEVSELYEQLAQVIQAMNKATFLEPSGKLKAGFDQALMQEIQTQSKTARMGFFSPVMYRIAAGLVLLMVGLGIGFWIDKNQQRDQELADLKKQVEDSRRMMLAMLDNQQSASQRMLGVSVAYELEKTDDEIVKVLVKTMNEDSNSNVRLAAMEALSKFSQETEIRNALIQSLAKQQDPVVQIALIQLLVKMKEKEVVKQLEQLTKDPSTMKAVKDEAYTGILKLS